MARQWQKYPVIRIMTRLGPVEAAFTDADHVSVSTDAHHNDNLPGISFAGQEFLVHFHLYRSRDWDEDPKGYSSVSKRGRIGVNAAPSHRAKIKEEIREAVREFVAAHPHVLHDAAVSDVNNDILGAEEDLAKLEAEIAPVQAKLRELRNQEAALTA